MGTQKTIAAQIQQAQADYILGVKANHPTLFQEIVTWFQTARATDTLPMPSKHKTEAGPNRVELRSCWAISLDQLPPLYQSESWVGLQTIVIVERTRHLWNQTTHAHSVLPRLGKREGEIECPSPLGMGMKIFTSQNNRRVRRHYFLYIRVRSVV